MGFKGSVESFNLADVFQNLQNQQKTGTLKVVQPGGEEKHVHFHEGQVRFLARGPKKPIILPEVFLARGLVLKMQLDAALEQQKQNKEPIGACLLALGHLTPEQLQAAVKHQIEEEIFDLFSWDKANFEFNEGAPGEGMFTDQLTVKPPTLPISHLIMEAARRVDEWERLKTAIPSFKEIFIMDLQVRKSIEKGEMEIEATERRVANLIDGARDVDDLLEDSYLFKFEVLTALGGFIQSSLVRPASVQELSFAEQECARYNLPRRRIKVLERILALGGENVRVRKDLAEVLAREQLVDKACIHYDVLAEAELKAGREDGAVEVYKRMLTILPKHVKAHEQLAAIYAKRGQKREAFVHYQELFETLRDQNHLREARGAGMCAMECDPSNTDLRTLLIDVLVADNQKDAAAEQIELLGDQAARAGNVKMAADSYRRAMTYRPNSKQLKKKLADAMLTKEDRRARKRKALIALLVMIFIGLAAATMAFIEFRNRDQFMTAKRIADQLIQQARSDESADPPQYDDAVAKYLEGQGKFEKASKVFSPIFGFAEKAKREVAELQKLINLANENNETKNQEGLKQTKNDLDNAKQALETMDIRKAHALFEKVLNARSAHTNDEIAKAAEKGARESKELISYLDESIKKLENRNQSQEFADVESEISFKRAVYQKFLKNPKLLRDKDGKELVIELPVWVKPDTDNVNVLINGRLWGTVNQNGQREVNSVRYPLQGTHKFEFRKKGYKTVLMQTGDLQASTINVHMEREPVANLDLGIMMGEVGGITLCGDPRLDGDYIYIGTTKGRLIQFDTRTNKVARQYDMPKDTGTDLQREIFGEIYVIRRTGQPEMIVFTTRFGTCLGITQQGDGFKELWRVKVEKLLSAKPSLLKLPQLSNQNSILAVPADKQLYLIDCEKGVQLPPRTIKSTISAAPMALDDGTIVLGCADGVMYGVNTEGEVKREWKTGGGLSKLRGKPILFDDTIVIGAEDGMLYRFDQAREGFPIKSVRLEGTIVSAPLPWKKRIYVGSSVNFYCIDFNFVEPVWDKKREPAIAPVSTTPVINRDKVYFATDTASFFALELEEVRGAGKTRWSYRLENGRAFLGPALVKGEVIYVINSNGRILPFDESE
jgi:outer membrane protein assembly factor BamB/Tfp pilus assembly protein PilF